MSRTIVRATIALAVCLWPAVLCASPAVAAPIVPAASPIEHLVVLMQSGHSFDNYFGTYPGADGIPPGICERLKTESPNLTGCVKPFPLGNRPPGSLGGSPALQRKQRDSGRMDGFVAALRQQGQDGTSAMGYYDRQQLPYYWNVADKYVLFDRFFSSAATGSHLNRFYWVTGGPTPGGSERTPAGGYGDIPTIFDRLQASGVSWKFYVEHYNPAITFRKPGTGPQSSQPTRVPLLNYARFVDSPELSSHIVDLSRYNDDLRDGTLPAVAYVASAGSSENPPGGPEAGQRLVRSMVDQLTTSRFWPTSAFLWTYDGWGGWYDHVAPPQPDQYGDGFRVPALLVSPYARRSLVDHTDLDYTAILNFIEQNWRIKPLTQRDQKSPGLMSAFDFAAGPRPAELIAVKREPPRSLPIVSGAVYGTYGAGAGLAALTLAGIALLQLARRRRRVSEEAGS
jgi:phospholipase C